MRLAKSDLDTLSSPYDDWQDDFLSVMSSLVSFAGSDDALLDLLFNDVLPFVKHEYTLYNTLRPVMDCITELLERDPRHVASAMSFLSYVFQESIRDTNLILVDPVQYRFLRPEICELSASEASLFDAAKIFYRVQRQKIDDDSLRDYFDVTWLNLLDDRAPTGSPIGVTSINRLLASAVLRFKHRRPLLRESGMETGTGIYGELGAALQGRDFDASILQRALQDNILVDDMPWAGGRLGVVAGIALLFGQSDPANRALEELVRICSVLKQRRDQDKESDSITTDQFLLEDVSVVLFREHLGARRALRDDDLNDRQRSFIELLHKVYRGYTYSLLLAGMAPKGINPQTAGVEDSIYGH